MSGWNQRPINSFPISFRRKIEEAFRREGEWIVLATFDNRINAEKIRDSFRHFRFCIRAQPNFNLHLTHIEANFRLQTRRDHEFIYLKASARASLETLNPHLEPLFRSIPS